MIPMFIWVTLFLNDEQVLVNTVYIQQIRPSAEHDGCTLVMTDGKKIMIKESAVDLSTNLEKESIRIRCECYKKIAGDW